MKPLSPLLTLDSSVIVAALRAVEPASQICAEILAMVPDQFVLAEPSIVYQEVCGTLARKTNIETADKARKHLDNLIHPRLLTNCDRRLCTQAYKLCAEYNIYAVDALYLQVALDNNATLISLDKEDFIDKLKNKKPTVQAHTPTEFQH
jgi:predicted nucleic acid-binding protein